MAKKETSKTLQVKPNQRKKERERERERESSEVSGRMKRMRPHVGNSTTQN